MAVLVSLLWRLQTLLAQPPLDADSCLITLVRCAVHHDQEHQAVASLLAGLLGESFRGNANGTEDTTVVLCQTLWHPMAASWAMSAHVHTFFNPWGEQQQGKTTPA